MADYFGPDAEIASRQSAYEEAMRKWRAAEAERLRAFHYAGDQHSLPKQRASEAEQSAMERAQRAGGYLRSGLEQHPAAEFDSILSEAEGVRAPELSGFQWWQQNPSVLSAEPLSRSERDEKARLDFILRRVHEASNARGQSDPMAWGNYSGPMAGRMRDMEVMAADAYGVPGTDLGGNAGLRNYLQSPYKYRGYFRDEMGNALPWKDEETGHMPLLADAGAAAATVLMGPQVLPYRAVASAHNTALPFIRKTMEGDFGAAADIAARSPLAALNPALSPGRKGGDYDWRAGVPSEVANALDVTGEHVLPWFVGFPRMPLQRPQLAAAGDAETLRRQLARRYHPDLGGSAEAMRRVNTAADAGDIRALLRMAQ